MLDLASRGHGKPFPHPLVCLLLRHNYAFRRSSAPRTASVGRVRDSHWKGRMLPNPNPTFQSTESEIRAETDFPRRFPTFIRSQTAFPLDGAHSHRGEASEPRLHEVQELRSGFLPTAGNPRKNHFGARTAVIMRPSMPGGFSTLATSCSFSITTFRISRPRSWCACSRPRKRMLTFTLSL